ncbi:hypothetical protein KQX54_009403 [Cotesia glomerata]|uniref:THAP-type domain-containing protein n=1 Tax=Cotesia glomerata TaxID=32391 RepID=A0AAV7I2M2_COTGL|nr:hypothetical protein KQX54_009403 [Cotesia glomerata]
MSNLESCRSCFVPLCTNTTKTTPEKMFLNVPQDEKRRKKWFQAVLRDNPKTKLNFFCCEDHFDCHTSSNVNRIVNERWTSMILRPAAEKRRRQQIIQDILSESLDSMEIGNPQEPNFDTGSVNTVEHVEVDSAPLNVISHLKVSVETQTQTDSNSRTVAVQMNRRPKYRTVSIQCKLPSIGVDKSCSPIKTGSISTSTSSIKPLCQKLISKLLEDAQKSLSSSSFTTHSNSSQEIYEPSENTSSSTMNSSLQAPVKKAEILKVTNYLINDNLKAYTGVPQEWNVMLEHLSVISNINITNIKLSLMKIRRQDSFERLSEQFGMSVSNAKGHFISIIASLVTPSGDAAKTG